MENSLESVVNIDGYEVRPLIFTPENMRKFWENAKKFPTIWGHETVDNWERFVDIFFDRDNFGLLVPKGLFWILTDTKYKEKEDFIGVFYLNEIYEEPASKEMVDAQVH